MSSFGVIVVVVVDPSMLPGSNMKEHATCLTILLTAFWHDMVFTFIVIFLIYSICKYLQRILINSPVICGKNKYIYQITHTQLVRLFIYGFLDGRNVRVIVEHRWDVYTKPKLNNDWHGAGSSEDFY